MEQICINGRDELIIIKLENVACFKACADYTTVYYISGITATISLGLSKIEDILRPIPKSTTCDFVRLGRSYIINQIFVYQIHTLRQKLLLSDGNKVLSLPISKETLRRYKQHLVEQKGSSSSTNP